MEKSVKELAPSLYNVVEKLSLSKRVIASLIYADELKEANESSLTVRFKNKYDGKGAATEEDINKLEEVLVSFATQIQEAVENHKKSSERRDKIARLLANLEEDELEKLLNKIEKKKGAQE